MAEKRVSVRLVAEGGRQVRAELEGIGEAGTRGFGRLSREMELANTRLAAFARRAGLALGAAAAAATASLGLIVHSTAESAAQIRQFAQVANATPEALQRWSAGARTVGIEQEKLADILKDVNDRVGDFLQTGGGPMADFFENVAPRVGVTADQFARLAAAALSVRGLAMALVFLRGALIRTGIGALIVGAGELVYQFSQLVTRVGGVGEAFRLLGDLAREVWSRIGLSLDAAFARMAAGWEGLKAAGLSALEGTIAGVVSFGDRTAAIFQGAYDAAVAIWGSLPGAIGDFAFQAANGLISGVEAMLNGVVSRINSFIETLNAALAPLPEWATGEGGVRIGILDPVELGRIGNSFEGAATAAGAAAADAFSAALSRTYLEPPDLDLGAMADDARARADGYREAAGMLADAAGRPLASWQALKDAVSGTGTETEAALADAAASADALTSGLNDTATAAEGAGGAARHAGAAAAEGAGTALTGWQAVTAALADYAAKARDIGGDIGQALVGAFTSAENAIGDFVKTGKFDFRDLVTSVIADLAKLAARRFILGPIANALAGALGGAGGIFANILHAGGMVGAPGPGRMVPALAFANAPRMHNGGWAGLRPDEVPAILQRGERVLSRREAAGYGQAGTSTVNVTINARDAESFRQSRTQVASDIARAVSLGRSRPTGRGPSGRPIHREALRPERWQ
jgi:hypothetical protein